MDDRNELNKLASMLLQVTPSLRCVGVFNHKDNTLFSRMNTNKISLLSTDEEDKFAMNLAVIKRLHGELTYRLGKVEFSHIVREKIQILLFHISDITIYVSCESNVEHDTIVEITKLIKDTLNEYRKINLSIIEQLS